MDTKTRIVTKKNLWVILLICTIIIVILIIFSSLKRTLTPLENALLWLIGLAASVIGSYYFSRTSVENTAQVMIKSHARSSFRRVLSLYNFLSRLANTLASDRNINTINPNHALDIIEAKIIDEIHTAADAVEEWRDIIPEDVAEIIKNKDQIISKGD